MNAEEALTKANQSDFDKSNLEDMINSGSLLRLPWHFTDAMTEQTYNAKRGAEWATGPDQWVSIPWSLLWVAIIARHWNSLTWYAIGRSSLHFIITIGPVYLPYVLRTTRYTRYRNFIIAAAMLSYVLHPGGGLYRDAIMQNTAEHTGLEAVTLFIRLLIGSRTLFWLILVFGYKMPLELGIPINAACLLLINKLRPSQPFCDTMQNPTTRSLFHSIAGSVPLISAISIERPQIRAEADICNPLVHWMQVSIGFLLPSLYHLAEDYSARLAFAKWYYRRMTRRDKQVWRARKHSAFSPWPLVVMVFLSASTGLWFVFMSNQMLEPAAARYIDV
ncbi:hypothetical protein Ndes2526B_g08132 [Nannochloris sp. 'desiccata']|nr:hypothetical protein KSW81_002766 [Chlorella desiccata (nom. nud.)]